MKRYRCAQTGCPNFYTEVIGAEGWGGTRAGGDCLPCHMASSIPEGTPIEVLEGSEQLMGMMRPFLESGGWTWQNVRDSYARGARLR
ncbi:MAG: hypothetical protein Q8R28_14240 [Dehalococcoidia bacterium]|nr:hypothetical protein [Dehalococcoidia bacterium]